MSVDRPLGQPRGDPGVGLDEPPPPVERDGQPDHEPEVQGQPQRDGVERRCEPANGPGPPGPRVDRHFSRPVEAAVLCRGGGGSRFGDDAHRRVPRPLHLRHADHLLRGDREARGGQERPPRHGPLNLATGPHLRAVDQPPAGQDRGERGRVKTGGRIRAFDRRLRLPTVGQVPNGERADRLVVSSHDHRQFAPVGGEGHADRRGDAAGRGLLRGQVEFGDLLPVGQRVHGHGLPPDRREVLPAGADGELRCRSRRGEPARVEPPLPNLLGGGVEQLCGALPPLRPDHDQPVAPGEPNGLNRGLRFWRGAFPAPVGVEDPHLGPERLGGRPHPAVRRQGLATREGPLLPAIEPGGPPAGAEVVDLAGGVFAGCDEHERTVPVGERDPIGPSGQGHGQVGLERPMLFRGRVRLQFPTAGIAGGKQQRHDR